MWTPYHGLEFDYFFIIRGFFLTNGLLRQKEDHEFNFPTNIFICILIAEIVFLMIYYLFSSIFLD